MRTFFTAFQVLCISRDFLGIIASGNFIEIPKGLSIGAATSAYQIEGAWNVSDKSESTWDRRIHTNASYYGGGDTGDVAVDSYHRYKEDVQIIKNMGLNHYRFSISWSRVLPTGSPDKISKDGIQYYKNLIDELLANGITPFVTIFHFDDVQSLFEKTGGWTDESIVEYFADYARVLFKELGPRVKFWTTINELNIYCEETFYIKATELNTAYTIRYKCVHNLLKAHARAYHIYNNEFRSSQGGQVGLIVHGSHHIPKIANDSESSKIAFNFETGWIMHPIFSKSGDYPEVMKKRIAENSRAEGLTQSRLPQFSPVWIEYIKGSADYLGLNHYLTHMVEPLPKIGGRWFDDSGLNKSYNSHWKFTMSGFSIVPEGIGAVLRKIRDEYNNPPVYILENGMAEKAEYNDFKRISYLYSFMREMLLAIRDGCDVRAYTIWSLFDNLEWYSGFTPFGLVHVDFNDPNRKRTPKLSSYWLNDVIKSRKLIPFNSTSSSITNEDNSNSSHRKYSVQFKILVVSMVLMMYAF